ncbi:MAG: DUF4235 domain-containing protein [Actinomycetaceae bacterium]|nr:DUF4235 domain-containing protein [Actinomycetaceae bacterium]
MANLAQKLVKTGVGLAAGAIGNRLSGGAWKAVTAKSKPEKNDPETSTKEAIAFAVLSAVIVGVVTTLAERRLAKWLGTDKKL